MRVTARLHYQNDGWNSSVICHGATIVAGHEALIDSLGSDVGVCGEVDVLRHESHAPVTQQKLRTAGMHAAETRAGLALRRSPNGRIGGRVRAVNRRAAD